MAHFQSSSTASPSESGLDKEIFNESGSFEFYQVPYGVIDDASASSVSMGANGWSIADSDYQPTNKYAENADADVGITESQFLNHFNKNFLEFSFNTGGGSSYARIGGFSYINPLISLPPAFRCFYSTSFSPQSTGKTINAMQEKKFLVSKTQTPIATGVTKNGTISADNTKDIATSGTDATTKFSKGDVLYDANGDVVGLIRYVDILTLLIF